jgi:hypothetical protein
MNRENNLENGSAKSWMIATISLIATTVIFAGLGIWALVGYLDQKDNVDTKIADAVNIATKKQADSDAEKFAASEKLPNRTFYGPDDYGRVSFGYPKTWSVYVDDDATTGGDFSAYLNPVSVPPTGISNQLFALRVTIEDQDYDKVVSNYESLIKKGDLKSSSITVNEEKGTRIDGKFSNDLRGSAVIFKIRDKTLTIRTDANTFMSDFDKLVQTIKFNQ